MTFTRPSETTQMTLFPEPVVSPLEKIAFPESYKGLAGFHKYWGKKPIESLVYLIENLTESGDLVMDPFLGSGLIARESLKLDRKFIGIDINPFSIEHASFLIDLPLVQEYYNALIAIEQRVVNEINTSYQTADHRLASHYLWEKDEISSIWTKSENSRHRIEIQPSAQDKELFLSYQQYQPKHFRRLKFFTNSRINVKPTISLADIFTGRAMRNIDLIAEAIDDYQSELKRALLLTLTSSIGQMSNMVFAIQNRKENKNKDNIEVGSWVIGFWLPETHFEINVWNCFKNRAKKLLTALPDQRQKCYHISNDPISIGKSCEDVWLLNTDCRLALKKISAETVSFICTDPPHSDRIPYLELSELWNALLGYEVDFEREIIVSNAKERHKTKAIYNAEMTEFLIEALRVLKKEGYLALYFNARDEESWHYLKNVENISEHFRFIGCFPMVYSATSVLQDNRPGGMKSDFVLLYQKQLGREQYQLPQAIQKIAGWSDRFPQINEKI